MSNKKNSMLIAVVITIILIGIPILLDKYIIGNNWPSNISNSEWVSFFGSYFGGLFGGILSIAGVFITIRYYKKQEIQEKEERQKLILEEIKRQHEIKYKFECLEELEVFNRKISELYEMIKTIDMLIENMPKEENPLSKIDNSIWMNFKQLATYINKSYNNLKSIYECKLSVFYKDSFLMEVDEEINSLIIMLDDSFDKKCKSKTVEQFYDDINDIVLQWNYVKGFTDIRDIKLWIKDIKKRFFEYTNKLKNEI